MNPPSLFPVNSCQNRKIPSFSSVEIGAQYESLPKFNNLSEIFSVCFQQVYLRCTRNFASQFNLRLRGCVIEKGFEQNGFRTALLEDYAKFDLLKDYVKSDHFEKAQALTDNFQDNQIRKLAQQRINQALDKALRTLSETSIKKENLQQAIKYASMISTQYISDAFCQEISLRYAQQDNFAQAKACLKKIDDKFNVNRMYRVISHNYAKQGNFDRAAEFVREIFCELTSDLICKEMLQVARTLSREDEKNAFAIKVRSIVNDLDCVENFSAYLKQGNFNQAVKFIEEITCLKTKKNQLRLKMALAYFHKGNDQRAIACLEKIRSGSIKELGYQDRAQCPTTLSILIFISKFVKRDHLG